MTSTCFDLRSLGMNLNVLRKSRIVPTAGDIFVFQLLPMPGRFFFGRVVRTDAVVGGFKNTVLIYLYKDTSPAKREIPALLPGNLLVPPLATNTLPWRKGYFESVARKPLSKGDVLERHVFRDAMRKRFFDDSGREIASASGLVGSYGLHSYKTIDDEISKALGLPLYQETSKSR